MRNFITPVLFVALGSSACGAAPPKPRTVAAFTPRMARLFDDTVDYVQDVNGLGGRVAEDWRQQIDGLIHSSDLVGVAQIETVVLGTNGDGTRDYRLTAALTETLQGNPPSDGHVALRVTEGQMGFYSVADKETRLQSGRYIVFAKWASDGPGKVRLRWHLTPMTRVLVSRLRHENAADDARYGREHIVRREGTGAPPLGEFGGQAWGGGP